MQRYDGKVSIVEIIFKDRLHTYFLKCFPVMVNLPPSIKKVKCIYLLFAVFIPVLSKPYPFAPAVKDSLERCAHSI